MTWFVRLFVALALGAAAAQVHRIRSRVAERDADPAALARVSEGLHSIPLDLEQGRYLGSPHALSASIIAASGADVYLSTQYQEKSGHSFQLYVGGSVSSDGKFHTPNYCMPAAGWEIVDESTVPFTAYAVTDQDPRMRRLLLQHGQNRMVVYYWFQSGGRTSDHQWPDWYERLTDLLVGRPQRPAVIMVLYSPVIGEVEGTEREAHAFLHAIGPHLRQAILQ